MDLWIEIANERLHDVLPHLDLFVLNEGEARELAGTSNLVKAGRVLLEKGPRHVVVKLGEFGAMLFSAGGEVFRCSAWPLEAVADPTGAGDTFLGAMAGYLAAQGPPPYDSGVLRQAVIQGSMLASFTCEAFSTRRLESLAAERSPAAPPGIPPGHPLVTQIAQGSMVTSRRTTREHHAVDDPHLVPLFQERQQAIKIHARCGAGVEGYRAAIPPADDFHQLAQADAIRIGGNQVDDVVSVDGDGVGHGLRCVGVNGVEIPVCHAESKPEPGPEQPHKRFLKSTTPQRLHGSCNAALFSQAWAVQWAPAPLATRPNPSAAPNPDPSQPVLFNRHCHATNKTR